MTDAAPTPAPSSHSPTSALGAQLIQRFQSGFPLCARPYAAIASELGVTEERVLETLTALRSAGVLSRVGPVFEPGAIGASTLAALAVPAAALDEVAELINRFEEVNHNYEREHAFNLWFVVTAETPQRVQRVLDEIERSTGLEVLELPLEQAFHIDLGFPL